MRWQNLSYMSISGEKNIGYSILFLVPGYDHILIESQFQLDLDSAIQVWNYFDEEISLTARFRRSIFRFGDSLTFATGRFQKE